VSQVNIRLDVAHQRIQLAFRGNLVFGTLAFPEYTLRFLLVAPEVWLSDFSFESLQLFADMRRVKDSSARA